MGDKPTTLIRDDNLQKYATENQWKLYLAACEHGSFSAAAIALNVDRANLAKSVKRLLRKAAQQGYAPPDLTHEVPDGLRLSGTSIRYDGEGRVEQYWNKTKPAGADPDDVVKLPDPKTITKISTLYDNQGNVTQQWVSEKPEDKQRLSLWQECAEELAAALPRVDPLPLPNADLSASLCACYPVGDHHLGMLAWGKETGSESYDLSLGEKLLASATKYLFENSPACEISLIPFLGDFMHYDSFEPTTPTSRNLLDADGRFPKMVRAAIRSMRRTIDGALVKHGRVHVIVEIGNHDLSSSIFLMECLANIYENEARVTVDTFPGHYHYFEFGKVLIGTHHGHGTSKPEKLPLIMAADRAEAWGRTTHRYWWTGHIHNRVATDFAGCSVESFRILAPVDAWAAQKGYRPIRDMKSIVLHKEYGEVARHTVNPEMFGRG